MADQNGKLTVEDTGILIDLINKSSSSLLFREFIKNCIEAILRFLKTCPNFKGKIICDVDPIFLKENGVFKLRIIDNGDGMTENELLHYLGHICVRGGNKNHGVGGNHGLGARTSSLPSNTYGVVYKSWKNNVGNMVILEKKDEGYGFKQFKVNGEYKFSKPLSVEDRHEILKDGHGTEVIFLGNYEEENTAFKDTVEGGTRQLNHTFTKKFFDVPDCIDIKIMENRNQEIVLRNAMPLRRLLDGSTKNKKNCESSGTIRFSDFKAHWWLMTEDFVNNKTDNPYSGLSAVLYDNEIYCSVKGRSNSTRLKEFGILNNHQHVYILIEPTGNNIYANIQRTALIIDGDEDLSAYWGRWSKLFYENLPKELDEFVKRNSKSVDFSELKKKLIDILKDCKGILYKATDSVTNGGGDDIFGGLEDINGTTRRTGGRGNGSGVGGNGSKRKIMDILLGNDSNDCGVDKESTFDSEIPIPEWVSISAKTCYNETGTRSSGDELEDKAASYVQNSNKLMLNADFRIYLDDLNKSIKEYDANPEQRKIIESIIRENYYFSLAESCVRLKGLCNSTYWPAGSFKNILTTETLTAILLNKSAMNARINRTIAEKIGKKIKE